jgi:hypothetical protein
MSFWALQVAIRSGRFALEGLLLSWVAKSVSLCSWQSGGVMAARLVALVTLVCAPGALFYSLPIAIGRC